MTAKASSPEGYKEAKRVIAQRVAAKEAPTKAAKTMLSAIKKWESLGSRDTEVTRDILMQTDFMDRIIALMQKSES